VSRKSGLLVLPFDRDKTWTNVRPWIIEQ
jgi:hypothetical protein